MNLKRRARSRNSPKRALNDCRRLDVKPARCWRSGCWAGSLAVHASLNSTSFSKCNKRPVSMSVMKSYSLFSYAKYSCCRGKIGFPMPCIFTLSWFRCSVMSTSQWNVRSHSVAANSVCSAFYISRKVRISLRQAAKRLSTFPLANQCTLLCTSRPG